MGGEGGGVQGRIRDFDKILGTSYMAYANAIQNGLKASQNPLKFGFFSGFPEGEFFSKGVNCSPYPKIAAQP